MKCLSTTWWFIGQDRLFLLQNTLSRWWCRVFARSEFSFARKVKLIRLTLALRSTCWPPHHRQPYRLLCGLPKVFKRIYVYEGKRHKKPTRSYLYKKQPPFSFYRLPRPSLFFFIFVPFLYWHCWISISLICLKFLSSTLPFAKKYPKVNLFLLFVMPVLSRRKVQKSCFSANVSVNAKHLKQIKKQIFNSPFRKRGLACDRWRIRLQWKIDWVVEVGE